MYTVRKLDDYSPNALDKAVAELTSAFHSEVRSIKNESDAKAFRDRWFARKAGILTQINDGWLKAAPPNYKREVGLRLNQLRPELEKYKIIRFGSARITAGASVSATPGAIRADAATAGAPAHEPTIIIGEEPEALLRARLEADRVDVTLP